MARTYILGLDDPNRPKKSGLVVGPERDDGEVRKTFYRYRETGDHPNDWPFLALYGESGRLDISGRRAKPQPIKSKETK